jgi:hypothetical protein
VTDFLSAPRSILSALDFLASEPSTVVIDISCSFMIVRLRQAKMHNTVASTVHSAVTNYCGKFVFTVAIDRSESSDLDRTAERKSNSYSFCRVRSSLSFGANTKKGSICLLFNFCCK